MKLNPAIAISLTVLMSGMLLNNSAWAKQSKQRWYEIEVILLTQLGDKSQLKESFNDNPVLPKHAKPWDLLTPFLNPDIASLKDQLAHCEAVEPPMSLTEQGIKAFVSEQVLYGLKSLTEIAAIENLPVKLVEQYPGPYSDAQTAQSTTPETTSESAQAYNKAFSQTSNEAYAQLPEPEQLEPEAAKLPPELAALLLQAEQAFDPIQLTYSQARGLYTDRLSKTARSKRRAKKPALCRLSQDFFSDEQQNNPQFDFNAFSPLKLGRTVDGVGRIDSDSAYLLGKESLRLKSIVTQLKWSKNFRPLLHLAWRQPTLTRRKARPMRLFAGDNLRENYKSALALYQADNAASLQQETALFDALQGTQSPLALPTSESLLAHRVSDILNQIEQFDLSDESLIAQLDQPKRPLAQAGQFENNGLMLASAPIAPRQDWLLDGLFKVHVDRYLHISADFNLLNMSLDEQASQALRGQPGAEPKRIRFKQDRRVISGEIHYFDHPYIGLIVQIRKYQRPK